MRISIIAILISLSAICYAQTDSSALTADLPTETVNKLTQPVGIIPPAPDTITLSPGHQEMLPRLLQQQAEIQRYIDHPEELKAIQAQINEKIMILLTGYVDQETLKAGKIQLSEDRKKIIVQ